MDLESKILAGIICAGLIFGGAGVSYKHIFNRGQKEGQKICLNTIKRIPNEFNVQESYIASSDIKMIYHPDLDRNGEKETTMKLRDKDYLFKWVNGEPVLLEYKVEPAKIVPLE